jgi:hypothetical protein
MGWGLNPIMVKKFLIFLTSTPGLGPLQTSIQWLPGVKWLECDADHSHLSGAKVRNEWDYTSTSLYTFLAWTGKPLQLLFYLCLWSSGTWKNTVWLTYTGISEFVAFIFKLGETLKIKVACVSKMLEQTNQTAWCHTPENYILVLMVVRTANLVTRNNVTVINKYRTSIWP